MVLSLQNGGKLGYGNMIKMLSDNLKYLFRTTTEDDSLLSLAGDSFRLDRLLRSLLRSWSRDSRVLSDSRDLSRRFRSELVASRSEGCRSRASSSSGCVLRLRSRSLSRACSHSLTRSRSSSRRFSFSRSLSFSSS